MTIERMREHVSKVYPSPRWEEKVRNMPDIQVIAVYKDMQHYDRLKPKKSIKKKEPGIKKAVQLSIFDLPEFTT